MYLSSQFPATHAIVPSSVLAGRGTTVKWAAGSSASVSVPLAAVTGNLVAAPALTGSTGPFALLVTVDGVHNALLEPTGSQLLVLVTVTLSATVPTPALAPASSGGATTITAASVFALGTTVNITTIGAAFYSPWYVLQSGNSLATSARALPTCAAFPNNATGAVRVVAGSPLPLPRGWSLLCVRAFDASGVGSAVTGGVYVTQQPAGVLEVQPAAISLTGRGTQAAAKYRRVVSVAAGVQWSVSSTPPSWITSVSPNRGTGSTFIDVTVSPTAAAAALAAMSATDPAASSSILMSAVTFTTTTGAAAALNVSVTLEQSNVAVAPSLLKHVVSLGGRVNATVSVASTDASSGGSKLVSVATDVPWARVVGNGTALPLSAGGSLQVLLTADTAGMLPGTYSGNVVVQSTAATTTLPFTTLVPWSLSVSSLLCFPAASTATLQPAQVQSFQLVAVNMQASQVQVMLTPWVASGDTAEVTATMDWLSSPALTSTVVSYC